MAPLEGSVSPQEDGVAADHHVQASWVCLGSDLSADPAAVVRRGPHQSSAGQEGHSGELAALLLGRRQWETVGGQLLAHPQGVVWRLRLPRRGCLVHNGEPNVSFGKGAVWANISPAASCSRNGRSLPAGRGNRKLTLSFRFVRVFQNVP